MCSHHAKSKITPISKATTSSIPRKRDPAVGLREQLEAAQRAIILGLNGISGLFTCTNTVFRQRERCISHKFHSWMETLVVRMEGAHKAGKQCWMGGARWRHLRARLERPPPPTGNLHRQAHFDKPIDCHGSSGGNTLTHKYGTFKVPYLCNTQYIQEHHIDTH